MRMLIRLFIVCTICACSFIACNEAVETKKVTLPDEVFKQKWYAGNAELSSYELHQARYGEIRQGEAIIIFVSEDFSPDKFVKIDNPSESKDKVSVLKMNMAKTFLTGIYPYSMMLSVFKPISKQGLEKSLKATCSSQEWCGHTFSQLQLRDNRYEWELQSYFESEAGARGLIDNAIAEDDTWNHIRINPSTLPTGKISMIPGLLWQRLSHVNAGSEEAMASLSDTTLIAMPGTNAKVYSIHYPKFNRTLFIYFKNVFPFEILGWEESYPDGFGPNKKMLTSKAILKKTTWLEYWKLNAVADSSYRDSLQLMRHE